jgi:hypothetical protein
MMGSGSNKPPSSGSLGGTESFMSSPDPFVEDLCPLKPCSKCVPREQKKVGNKHKSCNKKLIEEITCHNATHHTIQKQK